MTSEQLRLFHQLVDQTEAQLDAYKAVLELATNGYKTDQAEIDEAVAVKLEAKVAEATAPLAQQVKDLTSQLTPKQDAQLPNSDGGTGSDSADVGDEPETLEP